MVWETRKIMEAPDMRRESHVRARTGVLRALRSRAHRERATRSLWRRRARSWRGAPGVDSMDEPQERRLSDGGGRCGGTRCGVGRAGYARIISHPRGLNFWIVSDNVRKGAALNSVQIAELLLKEQQ